MLRKEINRRCLRKRTASPDPKKKKNPSSLPGSRTAAPSAARRPSPPTTASPCQREAAAARGRPAQQPDPEAHGETEARGARAARGPQRARRRLLCCGNPAAAARAGPDRARPAGPRWELGAGVAPRAASSAQGAPGRARNLLSACGGARPAPLRRPLRRSAGPAHAPARLAALALPQQAGGHRSAAAAASTTPSRPPEPRTQR